MATLLEQLKALIGDEAAAKIEASGTLKVDLEEADRVYSYYRGDGTGDGGDDAAKAEAERVRKAAEEKAKLDRAAAAARAAASNSVSNPELATILSSLNDLKTKMEEDYIPASKLPELETSVLSRALRLSDEMSILRERNVKELGKPLDFEGFNTWYQDETKKGTRFPSLTAAYESMTSKEREDKRVSDGIAEGVKQKTSSTSLPAVSTQPALTPALEIIRKAKQAGTGESAVLQKAKELRAVRERREGQGVA